MKRFSVTKGIYNIMVVKCKYSKHQRRRSIFGDSGAARFLARYKMWRKGHIFKNKSMLFYMFCNDIETRRG